MRRGWKFYTHDVLWRGDTDLHVLFEDWNGDRKLLKPAVLEPMKKLVFGEEDKPFLSQTYAAVEDNCGDVNQFLQAALDCAWERGMRPKGYADTEKVNTSELTAVRYHLEDMRNLALKPKSWSSE